MTKNIRVTDITGKKLGFTYPKRAAGLVKNGRAQYVDDCTIRLSTVAPDILSEAKQMNYIFLNPRDWSEKDGVEISFIDGFEGKLEQVLQLGSWDSAVTAESNSYSLNAATEYTLVFWLNGGENERSDEVCDLLINFNLEARYWNRYKLNRNYIKPRLHYEGWELYVIDFSTPSEGETIDVSFSFVSKNAPMAVKTAKEPEYYSEWEDTLDPHADKRHQRHNIVFEDGWPSINMYGGNRYSTEVLTNAGFFDKVKNFSTRLSSELTHDELDEIKDDLIDDYEDLQDESDDLRERFEELISEFDELCHRTNILSVSDGMRIQLSKISSLISAASAEYTNVQEIDLIRQIDSVSSENDEKVVRSVLSQLELSLDKMEGLLDSAEDEMEDFEDYLDNLEFN